MFALFILLQASLETAAMPTTYLMVNYRRFASADVDLSLEALCRAALGHTGTGETPLWERALDRLFTCPEGDGRQVMLNRVADLSSAVFGEMCLLHRDALQALIALRSADKVRLSNLTLAEIFPLQEQGAPAGAQFVRGMLPW
jgi:hypothetical protein